HLHSHRPRASQIAAEHRPASGSRAESQADGPPVVLRLRLVGRAFADDEERFEVAVAIEVGDDWAGIDSFVHVTLRGGVVSEKFFAGRAIERAKLAVTRAEEKSGLLVELGDCGAARNAVEVRRLPALFAVEIEDRESRTCDDN